MKTRLITTALAAVFAITSAHAQNPMEPLGGQPPPGSAPSVKDFDYQIKYQRAFEAVLWNMPAISIYCFRRAAFEDLGPKDNDIIAYSAPATPRLEAITANSTTPYITGHSSSGAEALAAKVPGAHVSAFGIVPSEVRPDIARTCPCTVLNYA
jgi:hypothetical protein